MTFPKPRKLFLSLLIVMFSHSAFALKQFHFREGVVTGDYDGVISNQINSPTLFDLELEFFETNKESWFLNTTYAMDFDTSTIDYSYNGGGMRYYLFNPGMNFEGYSKGTSFLSSPKWRFFVGWQAGLSFAILDKIGTTLQITTWGYDLGAHMGAIAQINKKWGLEFKASYDVTTGFTTVSVGGSTTKAMIGVAYYL